MQRPLHPSLACSAVSKPSPQAARRSSLVRESVCLSVCLQACLCVPPVRRKRGTHACLLFCSMSSPPSQSYLHTTSRDNRPRALPPRPIPISCIHVARTIRPLPARAPIRKRACCILTPASRAVSSRRSPIPSWSPSILSAQHCYRLPAWAARSRPNDLRRSSEMLTRRHA